ncbi:hypothetical protein C8Q80DRAFT_310702 [Daedaleopsis nitida]|nr:hypothetical protein C8Q80DRAFT_310702 [Daedaleopsis nitida]
MEGQRGQESSSRPRPPRVYHAPDRRPSMLQSSTHAASSTSVTSSFNKFPFHSTTGTTPSSQSHHEFLAAVESIHGILSSPKRRSATSLPYQATESTMSPSGSSDEQLPTRASIRAWAKATPAGPPRYTPSPASSAALAQYRSDDNLDRKSITRSAGHPFVSSVSGSNSEPGSGTTSSDEDSSGSPPLAESSGNIADVESAGSGSDDRSSHGVLSPSTSPPPRPPVVPHPPTQLRTHSSSSDSVAPAIIVSHVQMQDQQERLDRRAQRHPHTSGRRRHRDRERDRERRPRSSNPPISPAGSPNPAGQAQQHQHPPPHRSPLRIIPDIRLRLPPPLHHCRRCARCRCRVGGSTSWTRSRGC